MIRNPLFVIFLFLILLAEHASVKAQDVQASKRGVVRISNPVLRAQGTGFIVYIDEDQGQAFLITASHVVEGTDRPDVYLPNRADPVKARILNQEADDRQGLALIAISGDSRLFAGLTELRFGNSSQLIGGESGHVIGYPGGTSISTVTPAVVARREGKSIVFSGNVNAGNSGGPFIIDGKVVGVVMETATGLAYATSAEATSLFIYGSSPTISGKLNAPRVELVTGRVIVLVADFKSREQKSDQVTHTIITQLRNATKGFPDIEILYLGEHITNEQGSAVAYDKGMSRGASIVLWGAYTTAEDEVLVDIHFEFLRKPRGLNLSDQNETFTAPIAELKRNFRIQTRLSNKMAYVTLLTTGLARLESNDFDGAISRFTSALGQPNAPDESVDRSEVFYNRGRAYGLKAIFTGNEKVQRDLFNLAIADLNKYISLNKDDPDGYLVRALNYLLATNSAAALADTDRAIELTSKDYKPYFVRGLIYLYKDETERSIANFNRAIQLIGEDADEESKIMVYFMRGTMHMLRDDFAGAINDFTKVINSEPSNSPFVAAILLMRGGAHAGNGDYDAAIGDLTKAIKLEPDNPFFYWARGHAYADNANDSRAIENYTQAILLLNDRGLTQVTYGTQSVSLLDLYEARSSSYEKTGNNENAISDLREVVRRSQDAEQRQVANEKIHQLSTKRNVP